MEVSRHSPTLCKDEVQYMMLCDDWTSQSSDNIVTTFNGGSLWISNIGDDENGRVQNVKNGISVEWAYCPVNQFDALGKLDFDLLRAVSKDPDRWLIYQDRDWLAEGRQLTIGHKVRIQNVRHMPSDTTGEIRFKDHIDDKSGILFGIQLSLEYSTLGTSNGSFRNHRYFECDENCAVFYSLKFIRKKHVEPSMELSDVLSSTQLSLHSTRRPDTTNQGAVVIPKENTDDVPNESPIPVGEDVVWYSDHGPERGTIRWIGQIPELDPIQKWYAGVEFENPIGKGTGKYRGIQLFVGRKNHASLVPVVGLIRHSDFEDTGGLTTHTEPSLMPYPCQSEATSTCEPNNILSTAFSGTNDNEVHSERHETEKDANIQSDNNVVEDYSNTMSDLHFQTGELCQTGPATAEATMSATGPPGDLHMQLHRQQQQQQSQKTQPKSPDDQARTHNNKDSNVAKTQTDPETIELGERVMISVLAPPCFGIVRWLGRAPSKEGSANPGPQMAGLEMDKPNPKSYTAGVFQGRQLFHCEEHRAFFIYAKMCRRAAREEGTD